MAHGNCDGLVKEDETTLEAKEEKFSRLSDGIILENEASMARFSAGNNMCGQYIYTG